jgi:hypothetical protein
MVNKMNKIPRQFPMPISDTGGGVESSGVDWSNCNDGNFANTWECDAGCVQGYAMADDRLSPNATVTFRCFDRPVDVNDPKGDVKLAVLPKVCHGDTGGMK